MNFDCAELLSLDHTYDFWGDIFNYRNRQNMTISSRISGNPALSGVSIVWTGISGFLVSLNDYIPITVNSINLGTGRLVSVAFEPGNDVQYKKYRVSFEFLKTGNLWNLNTSGYSAGSQSGYYYGLSDVSGYAGNELRWLSNLNENFNFQANSNRTYSYDRNVSFELDKEADTSIYGSREELANGLANLFLTQTPGFPFFLSQYPNFYTASGIKYNKESYDIINGKYDFSQNFVFDTGNPWYWEYTNSLSYGDSTATVTEQGTIRSAASLGTDKFYYANLGWTGVVETGVYARCSGAYSDAYFVNSFLGNCPLINYPIEVSVTQNECIGLIQYSKSYTNNPAQKTGYSFSHSQSLSYDNDGYVNISEQGEYRGLSNIRSDRFSIASGAYSSGKPQITGRLTGIYSNYFKLSNSGCYYSGSLTSLSQSETFREYEGVVSYDYTYSDNPFYYSTGNFKKVMYRYGTSAPVHIVNKFFVPSVGELAQGTNQSTLGVFSNNIEIVGRSGVALQSYLNEAWERLRFPTGTDIHLVDCSYSFSPLNYTFDLRADYAYSVYKTKEDIFV